MCYMFVKQATDHNNITVSAVKNYYTVSKYYLK